MIPREFKENREHNLHQRWPDESLSDSGRQLLSVYHELSLGYCETNSMAASSLFKGYEAICKSILESRFDFSDIAGQTEGGYIPEQNTVSTIVTKLKASCGADWLQSVASVLGMLMHFSLGKPEAKLLINHRRPTRAFSTYPNSPAVARLMADSTVSYLLKQPIPSVCQRYTEAERYAERALTFRVLDPSMESGQLLLEIALAVIRRVSRKHSVSSKSARYLNRAVLEKLCRDCLWGIDRNELAATAVRTMFVLLGAEFGVQQLSPVHLMTADALEYFNQARMSDFDGIINNPPWGEVMTPSEKERLRGRFSTLRHQSDSYVAFSELAIRSIRPEGIFALILPSHAVAAHNTARLRELLVRKTELDQMILLPRSAFADATVRGIVLLGRARPAVRNPHFRVITYPIVKSFDAIGPPRSFTVRSNLLQSAGAGSWWPLLNRSGSEKPPGRTVALHQIADVVSGVCVYRLGDGIPPQTAKVLEKRPFTFSRPDPSTTPALRGRDVHEFSVDDPQQFIKFGKWLAWVGNHNSLRRSERIFVRELCRRDGKLSAAVAKDGFIPLRGVLTVVPRLINVYALVGVLNSAVAADYVSKHTASFSKVDFQKIIVSELRHMPIPIAAINPRHRSRLGLPASTERELSLHRRLIALARKLSQVATINNSKREKLFAEINAVVSVMSD
jgi:restriction endonuclease TaqI-like protein/N-6 DNA methylase